MATPFSGNGAFGQNSTSGPGFGMRGLSKSSALFRPMNAFGGGQTPLAGFTNQLATDNMGGPTMQHAYTTGNAMQTLGNFANTGQWSGGSSGQDMGNLYNLQSYLEPTGYGQGPLGEQRRDSLAGMLGTDFGKKNAGHRDQAWNDLYAAGTANQTASQRELRDPAGTGGGYGGYTWPWDGGGPIGPGGPTDGGTGGGGPLLGDPSDIGGIQTSVNPIDVYSPQMTQEAVNRAQQGIHQQTQLPWLLSQGQRQGVRSDVSLSNLSSAYNQQGQGQVAAQMAGVDIPFQHQMANSLSRLAGEQGRAGEFADLFNAWSRLAQGQRDFDYSGQIAGLNVALPALQLGF